MSDGVKFALAVLVIYSPLAVATIVAFFRRSPGPRWPWIFPMPIAAIHTYAIAQILKAEGFPDDPYAFLGSWAPAILILAWLMAIVGIRKARGSQGFAFFFVMAVASLEPHFFGLVLIYAACAGRFGCL